MLLYAMLKTYEYMDKTLYKFSSEPRTYNILPALFITVSSFQPTLCACQVR